MTVYRIISSVDTIYHDIFMKGITEYFTRSILAKLGFYSVLTVKLSTQIVYKNISTGCLPLLLIGYLARIIKEPRGHNLFYSQFSAVLKLGITYIHTYMKIHIRAKV